MRNEKVCENLYFMHILCLFMYIHVQDECSFVSLRDVERAMIVFEWFYENNNFFEELLKEKLLKEDLGYYKVKYICM